MRSARTCERAVRLLFVCIATTLLPQTVFGSGLAVDAIATGDQTRATAATVTTDTFSTVAGNELLLAFVAADDPTGFTGTSVSGVTGAGLTWQLVRRTNVQLGTAEIWRAFATAPLSGVSVTATLSQATSASVVVVSFIGADTSGSNGSGAIGATGSANASAGAPAASLVTTRDNSWVFGVGNDYDNPIPRTLGPDQVMVHQYMPSVGDTYWVQRTTSSTPLRGTRVTINDVAPTGDRYNLTIVEVLSASGGTPPPAVPTVTLTAPVAGSSYTAPANISLAATVAATGASVMKVDFYAGSTWIGSDNTSPYQMTWNSVAGGSYALTAVATDSSGASARSAAVNIVVNTTAGPSVSLTAPTPGSTYTAPATISMAATVSPTRTRISRVEFYAGSTLIGRSRRAPYSITWSQVPRGNYALTAVALHANGTRTRSSEVTIAVDPPESSPPTVSLSSPSVGSSYTAPASIAVSATARSASSTITRVDFYAGSATLIGSATSQPYSVTWNDAPEGDYALTAIATDGNGKTAESAAVNITVKPRPDSDTPPGGLLQYGDLTYQGAFRLPAGTFGSSTFSYGGTALAVNPYGGSLFIVGHDWHQDVAEIDVPAIRIATRVSDLATANVLQPFSDATEGKMSQVGPNNVKVGGLLPYEGQLYLTAYLYYDGTGGQILSHFVSGLDLGAKGDVRGPFQVGTLGAGFVSGYFGSVPAEWQDAFGGPVLNGNCCLGIISRTSYGPALFAINPLDLGAANPVPASPLVYYTGDYPLLEPGDIGDGWSNTSALFNGTTEVKGVVFPEGTRSVLFFGRQGVGQFCYGPGTSDPNLAGRPADGGVDTYCYDPADSNKGTHAYPYAYYVWAYDANDLAAVKAGSVEPWAVRPYGVWRVELPFSSGDGRLNGAAYDPRTRRIFLSQAYGDGDRPLIHVFTLP